MQSGQTGIRQTEGQAMRFYLAVTFWGEEYRRFFLDFCLASLLADGNLPAIDNKADARLLIATTDSDWGHLQAEATFVAAKKFVTIEHISFSTEAVSNSNERMHRKMRLMSVAHQSLVRRMFRDRAQAIFLYPDSINATGLLSKLQDLWRHGTSAVMFMNIRASNEGLIGEIKERGLISRGTALSLSSKELVRLALRHMHSELRRSGFESKYSDKDCSSYFWVVRPGEDLLFHCGSWIPLLVDYASLDAHDDSALENSTIDGMEYVGGNFASRRDIYFVRNTDEVCVIGCTPETKVHYSLTREPLYRTPLLRQARKVTAAHYFLYAQNPTWFWKEQFRIPIRFCGGDSPEWKWRQVERRAHNIVGRMEKGGSLSDTQILQFARLTRSIYLFPCRLFHVIRSAWVSRDIIRRRVIQVCAGDRAAFKRILWRLRHDAYQVFGRTIRDPQPKTDNRTR